MLALNETAELEELSDEELLLEVLPLTDELLVESSMVQELNTKKIILAKTRMTLLCCFLVFII